MPKACKNIIIVGTAYPYRGGLAAFNERLADEYQKQGHKVEIYTFTLQYPNFLFPGKTQFSTDNAPNNLQIVRKVNSINPFNWLKVGNEIRRKKPDIVIFAYWMSFVSPCFGTIACCIRKNKYTKCIGLVHNMLPHEPTIIDRFFPSYFVNKIDGFIALSKAVLTDISHFDKKNKPKRFSPHPIYDHYGEKLSKSEAISQLGLDANTHYILFFGLIRSYKGLDLLLDAFADKRLQAMNLKLIVAGEFYEDSKGYLNQIERLGLQEKVVLHTFFVPDSKVNLYFSACDIIAQPYKSATQSGVTQIGFHFEKPMLVTNVGGLSEIVPHGKIGYVVQPSPSEIANALVDFFANSREADFSRNVKMEKEKYAWSKLTDTISRLEEEV